MIKKDPVKKEIESVYSKLDEYNSQVRETGRIEPGNIKITSVVNSDHIVLKNLNRIFQTQTPKTFWLEIFLENTSAMDINFRIDNISLNIAGQKIICDPILLTEKVPEYVTPYGKHYFNTKQYNNFILGKRGAISFCFLAGFEMPEYQKLTEADFVDLQISLIYSNGHLLAEHPGIEFIESLKNMRFNLIQEIDEQIVWAGE